MAVNLLITTITVKNFLKTQKPIRSKQMQPNMNSLSPSQIIAHLKEDIEAHRKELVSHTDNNHETRSFDNKLEVLTKD